MVISIMVIITAIIMVIIIMVNVTSVTIFKKQIKGMSICFFEDNVIVGEMIVYGGEES